MAYDAAELVILSRLLDEAFELGPRELDPWLAAKGAIHQTLLPALRRMLDERRSPVSTRFLVARANWQAESDDAAYRPEEFVGPYRLLRKIGQGGVGVVWLADRGADDPGQQVALKLPRRPTCTKTSNRMEREARIGACLQHPQVVQQLDTGCDARGRRYIAFRYIDGQPLTAWADARCRERDDLLRLFARVLNAVAHAHAQGVVHRDLKPANILVTDNGTPHVIDFGIATILGDPAPPDEGVLRSLTPGFASPEQLRGEPTGIASDIYALGLLLRELVIDVLPQTHPKREGLKRVLAMALREEPNRRYASCDTFAAALQRCL